MAVPKTPGLAQISGSLIYGSIPIELFPDGTAPNQIPFWNGTQWYLVTLEGEGAIDISFDADSGTLTFIAASDRVYGTFTADCYFASVNEETFIADAVLIDV